VKNLEFRRLNICGAGGWSHAFKQELSAEEFDQNV